MGSRHKPVSVTRACAQCRSPFTTTKSQQLYCCDACYRLSCRARYTPTQHDGLATGTVGAMHEYLVQYDLMRRGYTVFRAASGHCPCDLLLLLPDNSCVRVEVRTGHYYRDTLHFPSGPKDEGRQDMYAIVAGAARIHYVRVTARCPADLDGAVVDFRAPGHGDKENPV